MVAEDHEGFRQYLRSALRNIPDAQIVCEVTNGLHAVQKVAEVRPDLILLDVGLPGINGMEAACRMLEVAPRTKVLFVSQETSVEVVQNAFSIGGCGYVVKADLARELRTAIDVVLRGGRYANHKFAHVLTQAISPATEQA